MIRTTVLLVALFLVSGTAFGHDSRESRTDAALTEKLGAYITADAMFTDETGKVVGLRDLIDKPTIIAPIYFGCTHACPLLLTGLAQALGKMEREMPGRDFQVVALSFDEHDTPKVALEKKPNYLKAIGRPFPENAWRFLTGDARNIRKFTDAVGFTFQKDGEHSFSHPVTLVVVAPGGRIIRYLEGVSFLPFEISMAVSEAAEGRVGSPMRKALLYCFSYDPLKKSYVFNVLKVAGTGMVLLFAGFFVYLTTGKKGGKTS